MARLLKNCPMCGGSKVEIGYGEWAGEPTVEVRCMDDGLTLKRLGKTRATAKREVVKAWNERGPNGTGSGKRGTG